MTPEELAALFKRRGDFDSTRKNLLSDFQNSSVGQQFTTQLGDILQGCIDEDPSLLQREKSDFHQAMVERITKSSEYKKVQQFVDSLLQPTQYMSKIENTLMTIVKEHAPPPTEKDTAQDDDKAKGHRNAKGHASTSSKQNKDSQAEDGSKENNSSTALASSSSGSTTKSATSATKAPSTKKEDGGESHRPNGGSERRTKDNSSSTAKVKKELNLGLPPRPQPRIKERHQGHATSVAPLVKKESSSSDLQPSIEPSAERPRKHSNHPRKRNRRQHSVDSNSSLSSPPSSSEADSDGDGKEKEGSRAKKLAKKAARDDTADNTSKASTRPETDVPKAKDQHASDTTELMEGVETAAEVIPLGDDQDTKISDEHPVQSVTAKPEDTTKDGAMDVDPAVTEAGDSMKEVSVSTAIEIDHGDVVQEEKTSMQGKESNKDFAPDAASSDKTPATPTAPVSTITRSGASSSSSSSSNPSPANNTPAVIGTGANRRRESDAVDRRASPGHHGSSHSKRTGHLPLPLPPRPSLSLPPKPTAPASSSRKASHVRNSSSITSGTGSATIKGTSSASSTSASVPPLSSSSSGSRQPSISGNSGGTGGSSGSTRDKTPSDRADARSSGQGHLHHPLPPPPHLHHPLPPTPRSGFSGSRSQSVSGAAKSATSSTSVSSSKPLISTSQTLIGTGPSSDNSAPTTSTPKSATSLTSPGSAGARNSPRTEEREAVGSGRGNSEVPSTAPVSKGDHSLQSPKSNSSSGSISSTGSLSTTGSTTNLTALSSPDTGTKEAAPTSELSKDQVASVPDSAQSPKPVELSATAKVHESTAKIGEALLDNDSTLASQSEAIEYPPTVPPPPPTSSPPPSAPSPPPPSPPPPPPPPPPEPPVASPTPPPPPSAPTPTPTPAARPPSSKQEKGLPSASPPSSSSSKPKSHGRTPIPLPSKPHKPIPLPQRPSAPASGGGLGSLKKKYRG